MSSPYTTDDQSEYGASHATPGAAQASTRPEPPDRGPRSTGRGFLFGCLIALVAGVTLVTLLAGGLFILFVTSVFGGVSRDAGSTAAVRVQEINVSGVPGDPKVVEIPLRGLLVSGGVDGVDPVELLQAMLRKASEDTDVKGVVLTVNSGGGAVTACDIMNKAVNDFRRAANVPVVALLEDVAASGGYYVACAADTIVAHRTTVTGSIGVLMPIYNAGELLQRVGVVDRTVKSGEFKNMASLTATKTPEQWEQEVSILNGIVQQMYSRFVEVVAAGRDMPEEDVRKLADGRIYTGQEAVDNGLVDVLGYYEDAIAKVKELAKLRRAHVVRYQRMPSLVEMLLARESRTGGLADLGGLLPLELQQRPMYLWCPAMP